MALDKFKELNRMYFDPDVLQEAETRKDIQNRLDIANWMIAEVGPDMEINDDDSNLRKAMVAKWDEIVAQGKAMMQEFEGVFCIWQRRRGQSGHSKVQSMFQMRQRRR